MKMRMQRWIAAALLVTGTAAYAQEDPWSFSLTPYGWLAGLDGEVTAGPITTPVDLSFSDILEDLDFTVMLALDGNNGAWGVQGDLFYVDLGSSQNGISSSVEQWIINLTPYLRVKSDETMTVDVGAGGRYLDTDVDLRTPVASRSQSKNWIDPVVMARVNMPVADRCFVRVAGDIGGFGVESDLTWQLVVTAGYALTDNMDFLVGYRHLDVDYEEGRFAYDMATSGLGLGLRISM